MTDPEPRRTPLADLHRELGGRMVHFAGWEMPIQYEGVIAEHEWCRASAALFDVSHMAVVELRQAGRGGGADVAGALEALTPASVQTLERNRQRYAVLTNDGGGVIDDLIITNRGSDLMLVVNSARRQIDLAHLRHGLPGIEVVERPDLTILALQGPRAAAVLSRFAPEIRDLVFLDHAVLDLHLIDVTGARAGIVERMTVSRSGYTGEDGFELIAPGDRCEELARALLAQPEVHPAGLGARDTLRLEAGLPLYGHELDETTSPIEAGLAWTVAKSRRAEGGFPGADRILRELEEGPSRVRVGLRPTGRRPVRDGAALRTADGLPAGTVTSGGYGPTVGAPVATGYVLAALATEGQELVADVRGKDVPVLVAPTRFVNPRYHRGT
jgi:aminomethyltransferase